MKLWLWNFPTNFAKNIICLFNYKKFFFPPVEGHFLLLNALTVSALFVLFHPFQISVCIDWISLTRTNVCYFLLVYFTFISLQCILRNNVKLIFDISKFVFLSVVSVLLSNAFKGDFYFYCILLFYKYLPHYSFPRPILILFSSTLLQNTSVFKNIHIILISFWSPFLHCRFSCLKRPNIFFSIIKNYWSSAFFPMIHIVWFFEGRSCNFIICFLVSMS